MEQETLRHGYKPKRNAGNYQDDYEDNEISNIDEYTDSQNIYTISEQRDKGINDPVVQRRAFKAT